MVESQPSRAPQPTIEPNVVEAGPSKQTESQTTADTQQINPDQMPPKLHSEAGRLPYIAELLEVGDKYDHFNMKQMVDELDVYLQQEGGNDSKETYRGRLDELVERLKPNKMDLYEYVGTLHKWVSVHNKLNEALKEKEELMQKSVEDMTADELREYIRKKDGKQ